MIRTLSLLLLVTSVGCGGTEECEGLKILVTVVDANGAPLPDADVSLDNEIACASTGDGTFECVAPEAGTYNLYAEMVSFEPYGQQIDVEAGEECDDTVFSQSVTLAAESAV